MASVFSSITVNQPVDKVFSSVTVVENHKAWQAGILEAKVTPDGPIGVGSTYHYTSEVMGRRFESQMQVSACEPNKKWSVKMTGVRRPVETVYLFEAVGNTTKLTISVDLTGGYPAAAEGMVKQLMEKFLDEPGNRVKQMVDK